MLLVSVEEKVKRRIVKGLGMDERPQHLAKCARAWFGNVATCLSSLLSNSSNLS